MRQILWLRSCRLWLFPQELEVFLEPSTLALKREVPFPPLFGFGNNTSSGWGGTGASLYFSECYLIKVKANKHSQAFSRRLHTTCGALLITMESHFPCRGRAQP